MKTLGSNKKARRSRKKQGTPSKTALVLAGGGLTGAVYEIGALRAIDELLVGRTVNDFDIIVGTSAGALVGSLLSRGFTPGELMQALDGSHATAEQILPTQLFTLNTREFFRKSLRFPVTLKNALSHYLRHSGDMNIFDMFWSLSEALPSGVYDNSTLIDFMQRLFSENGLSDHFDDIENELYVIATELDTGERVVFGQVPWDKVPISQAVAASSAVPLLYRPVRIGDHEFVDGAVRGNASLDVAIEAGAKLIVCVNPLVPIDNKKRKDIPLLGSKGRFISEKGAQTVLSQLMRVMLRSGLSYHVKQLRRSHPDVDIIIIEPKRDDLLMAFDNTMRYSARVAVAQHGFESVTIDLANVYHDFKATLEHHGINITRRFVIEELQAMSDSNFDIDVVREMLERSDRRRTPVSPQKSISRSLAYTLNRLEEGIRQLEAATG